MNQTSTIPSVDTCMGAIWWRTRGTCPTHFFRREDIICHVPPTFLSLGFVFGEVSKIKVMFVAFLCEELSNVRR